MYSQMRLLYVLFLAIQGVILVTPHPPSPAPKPLPAL
jgi:hypothetical protein